MASDTRLHTLDLGGKRSIEVMLHTPCFGDAALVSLQVSDGEGSAGSRLTSAEARAVAALLVVAADETDRRNARRGAAA